MQVLQTLGQLNLSLPLQVPAIERLLPHRPPFLLVDRVLSCDDESCQALKNVTINEPFFVGHFPGHPVMPGVLILEAMAQSSAIHACLLKGGGGHVIYLMGFDKARFRRPVVPGDTLRLRTQLLRGRGRIWKYRGEALVDDALVAEAEYLATVAPAGGADSGAEESE